ncbi:MAG: relaxase/mobilization nuclease domain-containing protein [Bacteroidetes bacterium]|nr:relaxase/mobilization nuclease domain-containing protein [Bacteroidota bacterium]
MIVKIKTRKRPSFRQLIEYMMKDKARLFDKDEQSFVIAHNLRGNSIDEWVKQFQKNEEYRTRKRKDSVMLTHEIISFHRDEENISLAKMEDMAREYIRQRNPNGIYLAVPHTDKEHYHIHICVSGVEYKTGKAMRMSKEQFQTLKKNIQQYQKDKYPELSKSIVNHEKQKGKSKNISDAEYQIKQRTGRASMKEELAEKINECLAKAKSMDGFIRILKTENIRPYERGGRFTGVWYENAKYRFSRLQIDMAKVVELNKTVERERQIQIMRSGRKNKSRGISK